MYLVGWIQYDEFVSNFDDNYFHVYNESVNTVLLDYSVGGVVENVSGAIEATFEQALSELNKVPQINIDKIPNYHHFKNVVTKNKNLLSSIGNLISIAQLTDAVFKTGMRAAMIKCYAEAEAEMRIAALEKFFDEYTVADDAIVDGFYEAIDEYRDYTDGSIYQDILLDILNNSDFWEPALDIAIFTLKETIASSAALSALGAIGTTISAAFIVVPVFYSSWVILNDGDELLESIICASTLEKLFVNGIYSTPIIKIDDMSQIAQLTNIRQCAAFLFYANFHNRLDSFDQYLFNWFNNNQVYKDHIETKRNVAYQFFTVYRPDIFPTPITSNSALINKCVIEELSVMLNNGLVTPLEGTISDPFTFSVTYPSDQPILT